MRKLIFIVPPKVHLLDINGPAHVFYEAKEYGVELDLNFVSLDGKSEIESSAGLHFHKLSSFHTFDLKQGDLIFIPGLNFSLIDDSNFIESIRPFFDWIVKQYANGTHLCSVCTGSFLLAESGLLNNKSATTHWKYCNTFSHKFEKVKLEKNRLFTSDERIHTSAGVSSGIDLSLFLIEKLYGSKLALDVAKEIVIYFRRTGSDPQLSIFLQYRNHLEERVHNVQDYLIDNLSNTPNMEELADKVYMSKRNLTRLFKSTVGITIGEYLEKLRLERATSLLSEGNKVSFVAQQIGLKSSNQLRNILKKHKGLLPTEISSLED